MHVPITIATLALLLFAAVLLRVYWMRLPGGARLGLLRTAVLLILLYLVFTVTKWGTVSDRCNVLLKWLAIASFMLLLLLFTRLRPRWLTSVCALVLLIPLFAAAILLPLTHIFDERTYQVEPMGDHLYYQNVPWGGEGDSVNTGIDIVIYYRSPAVPFLQHELRRYPFSTQVCNAEKAFAVLPPGGKMVLFRCPRRAAQGGGMDERLIALR